MEECDRLIHKEYLKATPDRSKILKLSLAKQRAKLGWPWLIRLPRVVVAVLLTCSSLASAEEPWRAHMRECDATLEPQCKAANCNDWLLPEIARCTIHRTWPTVDDSTINKSIRAVQQDWRIRHIQPANHDFTAAVISRAVP